MNRPTQEARIVSRAHRIMVCPAAPPQLGQVWVDVEANCPYCSRPMAEHEEFLALDLMAPEPAGIEQPLSETAKNLIEALDLLELWYGRWLGRVAGTPRDMAPRTRRLLKANGRTPQTGVQQ